VEATLSVLAQSTSTEAESGFADACHQATGGNPLLLPELVHQIAADRVAPIATSASRVPEIAARAGSRAVTVRLAELSDEAIRLARAVAVLGEDTDPGLTGALAELDGRAATEAADALAGVEILRSSAPFAFVHPLIAAAVYESIAPAERESAHGRAAQLLLDAGAEPDRVAAHLLHSPPSGDSAVTALLRRVGRRAASRGAAEGAVAYLRRALAEPPPEVERGEMLAELGSVEANVDGGRASRRR
jgi:predicted ATPase